MTTDDSPARGEPPDWEEVCAYLGQMDDAWQWGYCEPVLRRRVLHLFAERAAGRACHADLSELLMSWQVLHGFPLEYRLPIGV